MSILKTDNLSYTYDGRTEVLTDVNLEFEKEKTYAIVGKSGSGKTTLLSLLSGLDKPTGGIIEYDGTDIRRTNNYEYRSKSIGVVFQSFNLLPHLTALENVILSMDVAGIKVSDKKKHAMEMLNKVRIDEATAKRKILKLSGGEQQRVAIARVLSYNPEVILADEPTGNLDGETESEVVEILQRLAHDDKKCVIIVTHSPSVSKKVDVIYTLAEINKASKQKVK